MVEQSKLQIADCRLQIKFGTDGWRAVIAEDFTFENVKIVAQALADYLNQARGTRDEASVVVGYDTRFLSDKFAETFARVLLANGIKTKLTAGIVSTPCLSFSVKKYGFSWGVMFSASHNPGKYDGIKFRASYGGPVSVEVTKEVENYLGLVLKARPEGKKTPSFNNQVTVKKVKPLKEYFSYLRSRIDFDLLKKLKARIVVDPLYGCATGYFEELLKDTKISIVAIHNHRDPLFGGLQPEQVEHNLTELKKKVKEEKALLGIAFDGDADRLGIVTEKGQYLTPHQVFPLLLDYLVRIKKWNGKVVQTVSLGYLSKRIAQKYNLPFEEVPVGFKYISEKMLKEDVLLGGEESGGYGFKGSLPERDGVLCGLLFLEMLASTSSGHLKKKPSELVKELEKNYGKSFFLRIDLRLPQNSKITKFQDSKILKFLNLQILKSSNLKILKILNIDGIKIIFSDDSWFLLRPSGTEPLFRTYAESPSFEKTRRLLAFAKKIIYNVAKK